MLVRGQMVDLRKNRILSNLNSRLNRRINLLRSDFKGREPELFRHESTLAHIGESLTFGACGRAPSPAAVEVGLKVVFGGCRWLD